MDRGIRRSNTGWPFFYSHMGHITMLAFKLRAKASWIIPTFCLQNDSSVSLFSFHVNISLLAEQLQRFPCRTIPVNHWNRFASVSLFWFCFTNWLIFRSTIDLVLSLVYTILRQYQQNDNSNLLAERFQYFIGIVLQVNCCYRFIDMSWKQRNTGIILQAKSWNYSTCFGPKCLQKQWLDSSYFGFALGHPSPSKHTKHASSEHHNACIQ